MKIKAFLDQHFQIILVGAFVFFAVVAVAVFALQNSGESEETMHVSIWGTMPARVFSEAVQQLEQGPRPPFNFQYRQVVAEEFDRELLEALARDEGPDLILLPHDKIVFHFDKILPIPYEIYSKRRFKDTFFEAGEIYMRTSGISGFPLLSDPLVMYWNRDIVTSAGFAGPAQSWEKMRTHVERITERRGASDINTATLSFGEYGNVNNAKDIISLLLLQSGNTVTGRSGSSNKSTLTEFAQGGLASAESALRFYTEFSDPAKAIYTWNRALDLDRDEFIAGNLAYYFGHASEIRDIRERNPNLNFDVAPVPQSEVAERNIGFTNIVGVAIMRKSRNREGALQAAVALTALNTAEQFADVTELSPVRRSLLSQMPADAFRSVFYNSAIISKVWLDPDPQESSRIFKELVENITSGRLRVSEAVDRAHDELNVLFRSINE